MQASTDELRREATEAVNEATRTAAETSRLAMERMQTATQASRSYYEESAKLGRQLFATWAGGAEAAFKAGHEMQAAAINATMPVMETAMSANHIASQQWLASVRQSQELALKTFWLNVRTLEKMIFGAAESEASAK